MASTLNPSLWCNVEILETRKDFDYITKPFGNKFSPEKQLSLLSHFKWYDPTKLDGFTEEAATILRANPNMPPKRIDQILRGINRQIDYVNRTIC